MTIVMIDTKNIPMALPNTWCRAKVTITVIAAFCRNGYENDSR